MQVQIYLFTQFILSLGLHENLFKLAVLTAPVPTSRLRLGSCVFLCRE